MQVTVDAPDVKGRVAILGVHSKNKKLDDEVDLQQIALRTPGFTGARRFAAMSLHLRDCLLFWNPCSRSRSARLASLVRAAAPCRGRTEIARAHAVLHNARVC